MKSFTMTGINQLKILAEAIDRLVSIRDYYAKKEKERLSVGPAYLTAKYVPNVPNGSGGPDEVDFQMDKDLIIRALTDQIDRYNEKLKADGLVYLSGVNS